jgi:hypothetical protein
VIPYSAKGDLTRLPEKKQHKICGCEPRCKEFINLSTEKDDVMLCAKDAELFAFEILAHLEIVTRRMAFPKSKYGWTREQERFIIKYLEENPVKYGTYTLIGEMLGKSRDVVKNKIQYMKREGQLN